MVFSCPPTTCPPGSRRSRGCGQTGLWPLLSHAPGGRRRRATAGIGASRSSPTLLAGRFELPGDRQPFSGTPGRDMRERIALVLPSFGGGGVERMMVNLAQRFALCGKAVDVLIDRSDHDYLAP